jgi:bifunctional DNA-binding transcriptional regulator/antitoxin component of YhaV-PrlF toxin-antitoxin module
MMSSVVSERGQITVDKSARRALGVEPGMVAVQIVAGDHLEIYFLPPEHEESLFGALKVAPGTEIPPWEDIEKGIEESIAKDAW